jgi:hypothetical protein
MEYQTDPFRLWFEALHRSDSSTWTGETKDLLLPHQGKKFEKWWKEVGEFFVELKREERFTVVQIAKERDLNGWWADYGWDRSVKLMYVNLYEPDSRLIEDFRRLIQSARKNRRGRPAFDNLAPGCFALSRTPNIKVINDALMCWDLREDARNSKIRKSLYDIGKEAKICPHYVNHVGLNKGEINKMRRLMTIQVTRVLNRADDLIANVANGVFPEYRTSTHRKQKHAAVGTSIAQGAHAASVT